MKLSLVISAQPTRYGDVAFVGDLERNIGRLAAMGYDGVELGIRDPRAMDTAGLQAILTRHGMVCPVISTGQAWIEERLSFTSPDAQVRAAAVERIRQHIALAASLDTMPGTAGHAMPGSASHPMVMLGLIRGKRTEGVSDDQAMAWLVEALRECAATSADTGVRIVIEPINRFEADFTHSARDGLALLERVGSDHVGLILDTFHMNIEEPSIEESIRLVGPRLFHFHLSDSNRWHPGAGHIDFASVVRTLADMGYDGFLSGEFMAKPDPETAARRMIEHMRPLLREIGQG
jgi:sugar phosphate isomerase/epimerase